MRIRVSRDPLTNQDLHGIDGNLRMLMGSQDFLSEPGLTTTIFSDVYQAYYLSNKSYVLCFIYYSSRDLPEKS